MKSKYLNFDNRYWGLINASVSFDDADPFAPAEPAAAEKFWKLQSDFAVHYWYLIGYDLQRQKIH